MGNSMQSKKKNQAASSMNQGRDKAKWLLFWVLVAIGMVANAYYQDVVWSLRAAVGLVLCCALLGIAAMTELGRGAWKFLLDARGELRKVVWPTREETLQTLLLVVAMVVVVALILWGLDSVLVWGIGFITR